MHSENNEDAQAKYDARNGEVAMLINVVISVAANLAARSQKHRSGKISGMYRKYRQYIGKLKKIQKYSFFSNFLNI